MSRYRVSDEPEVVIGWDAPLGHFFAHLYDTDGELVAEYTDREVFDLRETVLNEWGQHVDNGTVAALLRDYAAVWQPGPLQRALGFTGKDAA